jgi:hypothetical protein
MDENDVMGAEQGEAYDKGYEGDPPCIAGEAPRKLTLHEKLLRRKDRLEDDLKTVNAALAIVEQDSALWSATYETLRAADCY